MNEESMDINLISLENTDEDKLQKILSDYFIESKKDSDGDILISRTARIYIRVDKNAEALRLFNFTRLEGEFDDVKINEKISRINAASSILKYSKINKSIMIEYGIPLFGHIDHKHLIKAVQHMEDNIAYIKKTSLII